MGIIDNLDFSNIDFSKFGNFKCLCELCDDGCFDRSKQPHHPGCTREIRKKEARSRSELKSSKKCFLTHYGEVYKSDYNPRPATAFVPPKELFLYVPKGPIDLKTVQKVDFKNYGPQERVKPFKLVDSHEKSDEPVSKVTAYREEFVPKENKGPSIVRRNANEPSMKRQIQTAICSNTTANDHFKKWNVMSKSRGFSEYPSYAGDNLFPNRERTFATSTKTFHQPIDITKIEPRLKIELKTNLKTEGEMDLATSYRNTFIKHENNDLVGKIVPKNSVNLISSDKKKTISGTTQTRADFVYYPHHVPPKLADCNPYTSNLNKQIYPNNTRDHNTIYSSEFTPKEYAKQKSCKKEDLPYEKPTEKLETETVTHRDFRPIDIGSIPALKVIKKPHVHLKVPAGSMETKTVSMAHFVPYEIKPRIMYSDPCPDFYLPKSSKFEDETTTKYTFKGEQTQRTMPLKPTTENIKIDKSKQIESNTSYKNSFKNHGLSMCEAKAFLIAKAMSQTNENQVSSLTEPNSIKV
ncbi:stabilizer of axonemal microtubules 1-like [Brachionus plicatilis]|uniref:Stabilizer of axonemal microtubules 1-like n=1 Tax=Brachionus plicatilis TaxID=10195 RepID=A0A3M7SEJ2_BRAPC|nr:stabilizer of axonemal microtubules 1-like [Brachionus plicatilis]